MADMIDITKINPPKTAIDKENEEESNYNGPPFISNIRARIQSELDNRAKLRIRPITPFVRAIPGFIFGDGRIKPVFTGILDNVNGKSHSEFDFYDLYSSKNAYRPLAGLTNFNVEYKNVTGVIRKATLTWDCHSLNDLEHLGPYFLAPGRSLLVEWGWNKYKGINGNWYGGSDHILIQAELDTLSLINYYEITQKKVKDSLGNYEAMLGIITNYDITMRPDCGFTCVTHLVSTGDLMSAMSSTQQFSIDADNTSTNDQEIYNLKTIREFIDSADFKKDIDSSLPKTIDSAGRQFREKKEKIGEEYVDYYVYKFSPINDDTKYRDNAPTTIPQYLSSVTYLSWGYIEDYILNTHLPWYINDTKIINYNSKNSKIRCHEYVQSTDLGVCLIPYNNDRDLHSFSLDSFDEGKKKIYSNPRRIMINIDAFINEFKNAKTIDEAITKLFGKISDVCGNLWQFSIHTSDVQPSNKESHVIKSVVDLNYNDKDVLKGNIYVFHMKSFLFNDGKEKEQVTSIIRNVTLNTKLSSDAALNVMYMSNSATEKGLIPGVDTIVRSIWNEYKATDKNKKNTERDTFIGVLSAKIPLSPDAIISQTLNNMPNLYPFLKSLPGPVTLATQKSVAPTDPKNLYSIIYGDQIIYPINVKKYLPIFISGNPNHMYWNFKFGNKIANNIENGRILMKSAMLILGKGGNNASDYECVAPMSLEMEIEGISGIRAGDIFKIDNMPGLYSDKGVFQFINITHEVSRETWKTKMKASFRVRKILASGTYERADPNSNPVQPTYQPPQPTPQEALVTGHWAGSGGTTWVPK